MDGNNNDGLDSDYIKSQPMPENKPGTGGMIGQGNK